MATETWNIVLTITQQADSVHGQATVRSVPARVADDCVVKGIVVGDSLHLNLHPVEDADINIVVSVSDAHLAGTLWLNQFTTTTHSVSFTRLIPD